MSLPSTCPDALTWHIHFLGAENITSVCSYPTLGQEELEFAIMRIEALKLARQIALASRSRQDAKVPVCGCSALPSENAVCATVGQRLLC